MASNKPKYRTLMKVPDESSGELKREGRPSKILTEETVSRGGSNFFLVSILLSIIIYVVLAYLYTDALGDPARSKENAVIIAAAFFVLSTFTRSSVVQLTEYQRAVVLRFGKFNRLCGPGWCIILPFIEDYKVVDMRIKTLDLLAYEAITKDNIKIFLDVVIYARIIDPYKATLGVKNLNAVITSFFSSVIREIVGNMNVNEVIANVAKINEMLTDEKESMKEEWGVELMNVEIEEIRLPEQVQQSMHNLISAEFEKQVVEQKAFAKEKMIEAIQRAASKLDQPALSYLYLEALKDVADGKATKLIFPMELTRLAESVSKNFGINKDKFLKDIMQAYKETVAKDLVKK